MSQFWLSGRSSFLATRCAIFVEEERQLKTIQVAAWHAPRRIHPGLCALPVVLLHQKRMQVHKSLLLDEAN